MRIYIILILISFCNLGCEKKSDDVNANIKQIVSIMVDKKAFPLPVPPTIDDTTIVFSQKAKDSLLQVKLKVALYPSLTAISKTSIKSNILSDYKDIFEHNKNNVSIITLDGVKSEKGHQIVLADTIQLKKSMDFENFDLLFNFSRFLFSNDNQKAFFILGVSRSRLAGSSTLYILKKEKEKWIVEYTEELEIW